MFNRRIISVASAAAVLTAVGLLGTGTALASTTGPVQAPGTDQATAVPDALSQGLAAAASDLTQPGGRVVVGPMKPAQGNQSQTSSQGDPSQAQAQASRSQAQQDLANDLAAQKGMAGLLTCSVQVSVLPTCTN